MKWCKKMVFQCPLLTDLAYMMFDIFIFNDHIIFVSKGLKSGDKLGAVTDINHKNAKKHSNNKWKSKILR